MSTLHSQNVKILWRSIHVAEAGVQNDHPVFSQRMVDPLFILVTSLEMSDQLVKPLLCESKERIQYR
jgi:hypothetical protein